MAEYVEWLPGLGDAGASSSSTASVERDLDVEAPEWRKSRDGPAMALVVDAVHYIFVAMQPEIGLRGLG